MEAVIRRVETNKERAGVLDWIVALRWVLFAILLGMVLLGPRYLGFEVHYGVALTALLVFVVNNGVSSWTSARRSLTDSHIASTVALDIVAMAVVLGASGGRTNPFSALFFVHVALAAFLLPSRFALGLALLAAFAFAALFALPKAACCVGEASAPYTAHLVGMWVAFVVSAALVAFFLSNVRRTIEARKQEIEALRVRSEQDARWRAVGTLAAGTAHELATPLATIAVLAGDLTGGPEVTTQAQAILQQVSRCKDILTKMKASTTNSASDGTTEILPVIERAIGSFLAAHPGLRVNLKASGGKAYGSFSASELEAAICTVLDNAEHAMAIAGSEEPICVEVLVDEGGTRIVVLDSGHGIPEEMRRQLGEPFLTTKEPGEGMGLGLYLVKSFLEQAGGALEIDSRRPQGTAVTMKLGCAS